MKPPLEPDLLAISLVIAIFLGLGCVALGLFY